jgi:hypothetical protein
MNKERPDISHLHIFGCTAYVYIPEKHRENKLSPKSELMAYLGHIEGIKGYHFMRLKNNQVYLSTTALFDENTYPKCTTTKKRGTTPIDQPVNEQPEFEPEDSHPNGETFDDDDYQPKSHQPPFNKRDKSYIEFPKKEESPPPDEEEEIIPLRLPRSPKRLCQPIEKLEEEPLPAPIPITPTPSQRARRCTEQCSASPVPLRRSEQQQKTTTRPGNVYGEDRPPTQIERDIRQQSQWQRLLEEQPGSSRTPQRETTPMPGEFSPQTQCNEPPQPESEDDVEDILYSLAREGGVKLVNHLLAQAVPIDNDSSPLDISKI